MKRVIILSIAVILCLFCLSCADTDRHAQIVATTLPVYDITNQLCANTDLSVARLITENVSCLHDYTLNPRQMQLVESAELLVISGAGFEDFMEDVMSAANIVTDASKGIHLHHLEHDHEDAHDHSYDPHIWLSPVNGKFMTSNIYDSLCKTYPEHKETFDNNLLLLQEKFDTLINYADTELSSLKCNELVTFHDGFGYMAEAFNLTIAQSIEEESGSEASARDLIAICKTVNANGIPGIFIEKNGSDRAAEIVSKETGALIYYLDTGLSGNSYFDAIYHNIITLKEALG